MYPTRLRIGWLSISLILVLSMFWSPAGAGRAGLRPDTVSVPQEAPGDIILEAPTLTPAYNGTCSSGWYAYQNGRGQTAYLAPNLTSPAAPAQIGEWRPTLPAAGLYAVEAFIPSHSPIDWLCGAEQYHLASDTSQALYTIRHADGVSKVTIDQKPLNDQWVPLGIFSFNSGTGGSVSLTDVTTEISHTRTVSFSAIRFKKVNRLALAMVEKVSIPIAIDQTWTADTTGADRGGFLPGEAIGFRVTGSNYTGIPVTLSTKWTLDGPCGVQTINQQSAVFPGKIWASSVSMPAPECLGVYTAKFQAIYQEGNYASSVQFVVNHPGTVDLSNQPAFDKCNVPDLAKMQAWWNYSPYANVNLYIGGSMLGCANAALDAVWIYKASQQSANLPNSTVHGWNFIPTWVGPQAPCSKFKIKMSANAATAYQQGRLEADSALAAATRLGLNGDRIIYYDLEGYSGATTSCRATVQSFLRGWNVRLHELGARAGIYGSGCTSYASDWAAINPAPDNVWLASWKKSTYDPNATVWDVSCLSNSLWPDHQRLRQYAGDHVETWGGVSMTIDSNVTDGELLYLPTPTPIPSQSGASTVRLFPVPQEIQAFQMVSEKAGWVLSGEQLLWTGDNAGTFQDITPQGAGRILNAWFENDQAGWVACQVDETAPITLWNTKDGGNNWELVAHLGGEGFNLPVKSVSLGWSGIQAGWLAIQYATSSAFSLGDLYQTVDGGVTWVQRPLPAGGTVQFSDAMNGTLLGGIDGEMTYQTRDGGATWQAVQAPGIAQQAVGSPTLPENTQIWSSEGQAVWALVKSEECQGSKADGTQSCQVKTTFIRTTDGGMTWTEILAP